MRRDAHTFGILFLSTFKLSAFTFGGGYVIIPLMRKQFVDRLGWLEEQEMLDLTAIAQSSPGPIAVNAAILLGYRVAGVPGALVTMLGTVIPPLVILSVISLFYDAFRSNLIVSRVMKGMQAGVAAVIFDVVLTMAGQIIGRKRAVPIVTLARRVHRLLVFRCAHPFDSAGLRAHRPGPVARGYEEGGGGMIYWQLLWSFFQIGLFSIGGGYAAMPLIQHQVVEVHPWLTLTEFTDIVTLSQMTPGPIAINSATFVGMRIAGISGALVATAGCVLPSCVIALLLAWVYYRYRSLSVIQGVLGGVRPAVVAMIASAG